MWPSYFSTCIFNFILYRGGFVKSAQDNSAPNARFLVVGPGKVCLGHHCGLKNESIGTCPCISKFCCRVLGRGCVWWARSHLWGLRTELLFLPPVSCPSHIFVLWQLPLSSVFLGVPLLPARLLSWCPCSEDEHHGPCVFGHVASVLHEGNCCRARNCPRGNPDHNRTPGLVQSHVRPLTRLSEVSCPWLSDRRCGSGDVTTTEGVIRLISHLSTTLAGGIHGE